jgi:hypothetical protein
MAAYLTMLLQLQRLRDFESMMDGWMDGWMDGRMNGEVTKKWGE